MVQVINKSNLSSLTGSTLGTATGRSIGNALETLADVRAKQLAKRQGLEAFENEGYTPTEAAFIQNLPEKYRWEAAQALRSEEDQPQQQQQQPTQYQQQQQPFQQQNVQEQPNVNQLRELIQSLGALRKGTPLSEVQGINALKAQNPLQPFQQQPVVANIVQPAQQQQAAPTQQRNAVAPKQLPDQVPDSLGEPSRPLNVKQKLARHAARKEQAALDKEERAERASRFKETKEDRRQILEEGRLAKDDLDSLERLEELDSTNNLDTPGYVEGLKRAGLDIPALMNPESEEFQKISGNFLRNAKTYYGGRVSNQEMEQFLKLVPSLSQSPEGRKRVISQLKNFARLKVEYSKALKDIMKENKGVPPYDLLEQLDDRLDSKREALAKQFRRDLARPVPKGQNKLITALQAVAGSAAPYIPGAVAGGLLGGPLGAVLGSLGSKGLTKAVGSVLE